MDELQSRREWEDCNRLGGLRAEKGQTFKYFRSVKNDAMLETTTPVKRR